MLVGRAVQERALRCLFAPKAIAMSISREDPSGRAGYPFV